MVEDIHVAIQQILATLEANPTYLLTIYDSDGAEWLRFAGSKTSVDFPAGGDDTYYPRHFTFRGISNDPIVTRIKIDVANFGDTQDDSDNGDMVYYHTQIESFKGLRAQLCEVYRDSSDNFSADSTEKIVILDGHIQAVSFDYGQCQLTIGSKYQLDYVRLWRAFQTTCPFTFGDSDCNRDSLFYLPDDPAVGVKLWASDTVYSSASPYTAIVLTTSAEPDDYWLYGKLIIGSETRRIVGWDSDTKTVTVGIGFSTDPSEESCTIQKGCSRDWSACCGQQAWGPSHWDGAELDQVDNSYNFGGFAHMKSEVS